jgi:hypothetical protein
MEAQKMDRGTEAMGKYLTDMKKLSVRQTRRGCFQELLGCEAKTEMKYFTEGTDQIATSLEDSDCCLRLFCAPIRPFKTEVKELETEAEILTVERPLACAVAPCKCCCYQSMTFSSGGNDLGKIDEEYFYCVPRFTISDEKGNEVYKVHQPTCVGGMCVNCFTEGNPCCGSGCCKVAFHIYPASQEDTDGDANYDGKIVKVPKSLMTELFTEAEAFDITFPEDASSQQKAMLTGTALFINANFFEGNDDGGQ